MRVEHCSDNTVQCSNGEKSDDSTVGLDQHGTVQYSTVPSPVPASVLWNSEKEGCSELTQITL